MRFRQTKDFNSDKFAINISQRDVQGWKYGEINIFKLIENYRYIEKFKSRKALINLNLGVMTLLPILLNVTFSKKYEKNFFHFIFHSK